MKQTEPTTAEIVKALRCYEANDCDDCRYKMEFARFVACDVCEIRGIAADRLEQQDEAIRGAKVIAEIKRLQARLEATISGQETLQKALDASQRMAQDARNELCLKCGRYHEAHNGSCGGCRWKE